MFDGRKRRWENKLAAGVNESGLIMRILRRVQALAETNPDAG